MPEQIPDNVAVIDAHLDDFFKAEETFVLHEIESETVHSDIFIIQPNPAEGRNYYTLLSCGLSALPMHPIKGYQAYRYAELVLLLPPDWVMEYDRFEDENHWWPFRIMKEMTKYPHQEKTWLGYGHTYSYSGEEHFSDNNRFVGVILLESTILPKDFLQIKKGKKVIHIWSLIPLYKEELEFRSKYGTDQLLERLKLHHISEIVDINRINVCSDAPPDAAFSKS